MNISTVSLSESPPTKQNLSKQTLSGFKWTYLSTFIQFGLGFVTFTTLAHLLSPREFGIVNIATIFTNFIERVGFLGVGQAIVQREKLSQAHIRCGFALCLIFGILLFALFFFAAPALALFFEEPQLVLAFRVVSLSFVFACVGEISVCLLQREMKFKELLYVNNVSFFIGYSVTGILLAVFGFSFWSLIGAILVARVVRLVLAFRQRPQRLSGDFSIKEVKDLLGIGAGFSLGRATNYCALVGDEFVTGKLLGAQALGLYSRAYQLMTAPASYFGQVLEKVFFVALSQRQSEPAKVGKYYLYGIELCSLVSVGGAVMLTVAAEEIVTVLFGPQWIGAAPAVRILGFGVFFRTCYKNSDTVIRALGAVYRLAFRQALYGAVVVLGSIFGSRWGIEGVACAVLFAVFLNYALLSYLCVRLLSLSWRAFARAHLSTVWVGFWQFTALMIYFTAVRSAEWNNIISLGCGSILLGLVTLLALWLCPQSFSPKVFRWLGRNVAFDRFGAIGRIVQQFLLRGVPTAPLCSQGAETAR